MGTQQPEQLGTDELQRYWQELGKARSAEADNLEKLFGYRRECARVMQQLADLPKRLQHPIMVPVGKHAFFPGQLYHTNEVTVDIGAGYHVQCTAPQATAILERRCTFLDKAIRLAQKQLRVLDTKQAAAGSTAEQQPKEIRHTEEESDALLATARRQQQNAQPAAHHRPAPPQQPKMTAAAVQDFQAQLRELERQEAAAEAAEAASAAHEAASSPAAASVPPGSSAGLLQAMEQLEMESDSDDEPEPAGGPAAPQPAAAFQPVDLDDLLDDEDTAQGAASPQQPQHQPPRQWQQQGIDVGARTAGGEVGAGPGSQAAAAAAAVGNGRAATPKAAAAARPQPKSILKKGFLLSSSSSPSSSAPRSASDSHSASASTTSATLVSSSSRTAANSESTSRPGGAGTAAAAAAGQAERGRVPQALVEEGGEVARRREEAFTGQVLEKPGDALQLVATQAGGAAGALAAAEAAAAAGPAGRTSQVADAAATATGPAGWVVGMPAGGVAEPEALPAAGKKLSKFKQKALGLL